MVIHTVSACPVGSILLRGHARSEYLLYEAREAGEHPRPQLLWPPQEGHAARFVLDHHDGLQQAQAMSLWGLTLI